MYLVSSWSHNDGLQSGWSADYETFQELRIMKPHKITEYLASHIILHPTILTAIDITHSAQSPNVPKVTMIAEPISQCSLREE